MNPVILIILGLAAYFDHKKGIIPNWLSYSTISIGIFFQALTNQEWWIPIVLTIITFIVGIKLWEFNAIGAGDVKILTGISLINPFFTFLPIGLLLIAMGATTAFIHSRIEPANTVRMGAHFLLNSIILVLLSLLLNTG